MTTLPPLAALAIRLRGLFYRPPAAPPALPTPTHYLLTHELGGPSYDFHCTPEQVPMCLYGVPAHGLSDVCREVLAEAIRRKPGEPAKYGDYWTLQAVRGEAE